MGSQQYFNPYSGKTFFEFIVQLVIRLWEFIRGDLPLEHLAADEIQVVVLMGVGISSALVGTFLVLRKMTMLANSLSHTILLGIVIAFLLTRGGAGEVGHDHEYSINIEAMLFGALVMGLLTTFLTELLTKWARLQEDASMGIVFTSLFSIGVITVTLLTRNAHIGTEVVMGNVDALQLADCKLVYIVLLINLLLFVLFFKEYKITTFDSALASALGISSIFFNYLLMAQVSVTAIAAFRAVGVLMVLAFITGPALTARLLVHDLKKMLVVSALIGAGASVVGVALSRHILTVYGIALSTAGLVVCTIFLFFLIVAVYVNKHFVRSWLTR